MQVTVAITASISEYKSIIEDLFQTSLSDEEAGGFIYNKEYKIQDGIIFTDPRRTLKEAIGAPQTIVFLIEIGKDFAIGAVAGIIATILYNKLKNCSWLKIGEQTSKITLEDIRKIIREELERQKKEDDD